jgi:hypothetical protein
VHEIAIDIIESKFIHVRQDRIGIQSKAEVKRKNEESETENEVQADVTGIELHNERFL